MTVSTREEFNIAKLKSAFRFSINPNDAITYNAYKGKAQHHHKIMVLVHLHCRNMCANIDEIGQETYAKYVLET